jgi:hypothetical protein
MESKNKKPTKKKSGTSNKVTTNKTIVKSKKNNLKTKQRPEDYGRNLHLLEWLTIDMS